MNIYSKLYKDENINIGDLVSLDALTNRIYKSNMHKKDRILGVCVKIDNEKFYINSKGVADVNIIRAAFLGDKLKLSDIPGKAEAIKYNQLENMLNIRSIGKVIGIYETYDYVKVLLDIE